MSRWLSYRPPAPFIPNYLHTSFLRHPRLVRESRHSRPARHPRLDRGSLRRQRLQHRALAASQPCTGKCALTLQPTAAFHHHHPRLRPGILSCLWQGARRALWGGAPRSAQPAGGRIFRRRCQDQIVTPRHPKSEHLSLLETVSH